MHEGSPASSRPKDTRIHFVARCSLLLPRFKNRASPPQVLDSSAVEFARLVHDLQRRNQLLYKLDIDYPAESALRAISAKLRREGWKPLKRDFMNPSIPSSHVSGWEQFDDDTTKPRTTVRQWIGQRENKRREIVCYSLEYRYPTGGISDLHNLQVVAQFIPASVAARMQEEIHATKTKK